MKVYIVTKDDSPYCVFSDKDDAITWVEKYIDNELSSRGCEWEQDPVNPDTWLFSAEHHEDSYIDILEFHLQ
tara:strand:+ start:2574 stop:2789 length:216 start_codon:yes stop_codon:yes gene_type:complete